MKVKNYQNGNYMRIISKNKDYYDSASAYGIDKERIYLREKKTVKTHVKQESSWSNRKSEIYFGKFSVIGFAGSIYPYQSQTRIGESKPEIIFGDEAIRLQPNNTFKWRTRNVADDKKPLWIEDDFYERDYNPKWYRNWNRNPQEIYNELTNNKKLLSFFDEFETPVFQTSGKFEGDKLIIEINPLLKELEFYRLKDAVTAFAEIDQFLGNRLVKDTEVDLPAGDNSTLARSKGFDENSFKKDATKPKYGKRKRKNKI